MELPGHIGSSVQLVGYLRSQFLLRTGSGNESWQGRLVEDGSIVICTRRAKLYVQKVVHVVHNREKDGGVSAPVDVVIDGFTLRWENFDVAPI